MTRRYLSVVFSAVFICSGNSLDLFEKNSCKHFISYPIAPIDGNCAHNPNVLSKQPEMVIREGYKWEEHPLTTKDGYIIKVFRIPNPGGPPVMIQHGILTNSNVWVDKGRNKSLAFVLHDVGYDVWLSNVRGVTYTKEHVKLPKGNNDYYDYSLDTLALIDLPLMMEFIKSQTKQKLTYIGHSMGTTLPTMFASDKPDEAKDLLNGLILMSPVIYIDSAINVKPLMPFGNIIKAGLDMVGVKAVFKHEFAAKKLFTVVCRFTPFVCHLGMQLFAGKDPQQFPASDLILYFTSWPTTASTRMLIQYLQIGHKKRFQKFDFGANENKKVYKQLQPPAYDLGQINIPVYMFYGKNDLVANEKDITKAYKQIKSQKKMIHISLDGKTKFNHLNFLYATNVQTLLFPNVLKVLSKLSGKGKAAKSQNEKNQQAIKKFAVIKEADEKKQQIKNIIDSGKAKKNATLLEKLKKQEKSKEREIKQIDEELLQMKKEEKQKQDEQSSGEEIEEPAGKTGFNNPQQIKEIKNKVSKAEKKKSDPEELDRLQESIASPKSENPNPFASEAITKEEKEN